MQHFLTSQPTFYLLNNTVSYMLGLRGPQRKTKILHGQRHNPQPKIPANPATLSTFPTGTNSDFAKFVFKPDTASKHKKKPVNCVDDLGQPHRKAKYHQQIEDGKYQSLSPQTSQTAYLHPLQLKSSYPTPSSL